MRLQAVRDQLGIALAQARLNAPRPHLLDRQDSR
jgi:hypothetical protein